MTDKPFNKAAYDAAYMKQHSVKKEVRFGRETDAELLTFIDAQPEGFSKLVRRLLVEEMNRQHGKE